jgi:hypothetical protein
MPLQTSQHRLDIDVKQWCKSQGGEQANNKDVNSNHAATPVPNIDQIIESRRGTIFRAFLIASFVMTFSTLHNGTFTTSRRLVEIRLDSRLSALLPFLWKMRLGFSPCRMNHSTRCATNSAFFN